MKFFADFHIHSRYSRATSSRLVPEILDRWASIKGLAVIGTGDFTHPGWIEELKQKLVPAEDGLFILSPESRRCSTENPDIRDLPVPARVEGFNLQETRFLLSAEISTIYSAGGRVRKVHHVLLAPSFEAADRIRERLGRIGNLSSDGRPILGLDSRDLLEIVLEADPENVLIPAHIWTPWFSALGSKSGFNSIREAYRDMADHIFAVETGLSSDPPMNWLCRSLDSYAIISNSDAHSPENLGREANRFETELSYSAIISALKSAAGRDSATGKNSQEKDTRGSSDFLGTVEFFPQEGKYHFDGHRKCGVVMNPVETARQGGVCPACGKPLTVGVMNRVISLADRMELEDRPRRRDFVSLIPLVEILSELVGTGTTSRTVTARYWEIIQKGGPELWILAEAPIEQVGRIGGESLAEGIRRMREREIFVAEGYDGEYGRIRVFSTGVPSFSRKEGSLFFETEEAGVRETGALGTALKRRGLLDFDIRDLAAIKKAARGGERLAPTPKAEPETRGEEDLLTNLNPEQRRAVEQGDGPLLILAGPGTGKTNTLAHRIAYLVARGTPPETILALTFTHKAAEEMRSRIEGLLRRTGGSGGNSKGPSTTEQKESVGETIGVRVLTFHSFGLEILKEMHQWFGRTQDFFLVSGEDRRRILQKLGGQDLAYESFLEELNAFDLDDLIALPVNLFERNPDVLAEFRRRFSYILVDEYQDVNEMQYRLLRLLASEESANLTVIGDPDQAIYGFRGADVRFIRRFTEDYPAAAVIHLTTSYRCPETVLKASRQVMEAGENRVRRPLLSGIPDSMKILISEHPSDAAEAEFIARTIEELTGGMGFFSIDSGVSDGRSETCDPGEIAILCRISRQMECLEKALTDHRIPYTRVGEASFFQEEPIAALLDIARFLTLPDNPYLRELAAERLNELYQKKIIPSPVTLPALLRGTEGLLSSGPVVPAQEALRSLADLLGFLPSSGAFPPRFSAASGAIEHLFSLAAGHSLKGFLHRVLIGSPQDDLQYRTANVTLSTIHGVKGLEFACVFIAGCEEGLIPYTLFDGLKTDTGQRTNIEEERRLFYVGMTRAKRSLYLTRAKRRFLFGREYSLEASSFLRTIEEELVARIDSQALKKMRDPQLFLF
jgi:uncharacterized protein (TIGR00375 family)